MMYDLLNRLLSWFGFRLEPQPDLAKHGRTARELGRAVRLTRETFPEALGPTGNVVEDLVSGTYQEPRS